MDHELISADDFSGLPQDPQKRFLALERICRRRISELITNETSQQYDANIRVQYMNTVAAAAEELGIDDLRINYNYDDIGERFERFLGDVTFQATKLNLRTTTGSDRETVLLANATRAKIELQIRRLREMVLKSDLPQQRKDGLIKKLDAFSEEVIRPRARFAVAMAALAAVGLATSEGTSFFADAPDALLTINRLFGMDKEAEEAEQIRLSGPAPQRALPAPTNRTSKAPSFEPASLDDDIPF